MTFELYRKTHAAPFGGGLRLHVLELTAFRLCKVCECLVCTGSCFRVERAWLVCLFVWPVVWRIFLVWITSGDIRVRVQLHYAV